MHKPVGTSNRHLHAAATHKGGQIHTLCSHTERTLTLICAILHGPQTTPLTGEEVDARDAFKLLRRVMLPPQWLPEGSEPLEVGAVKSAKVHMHRLGFIFTHSCPPASLACCLQRTPQVHRQARTGILVLCALSVPVGKQRPFSIQGLAFGMLKTTGTGVKFLRGSGFLIGRSVNSRRETRWSAPSYFHMDIRGLPPQFRGARVRHQTLNPKPQLLLSGHLRPATPIPRCMRQTCPGHACIQCEMQLLFLLEVKLLGLHC